MKHRWLTWILTAIIFAVTVAITFATNKGSRQASQVTPTPSPTPSSDLVYIKDMSVYPIVDFNAIDEHTADERERRRLISERYDGQEFVRPVAYPEDEGVYRTTEVPPPPPIPVAESGLIIVGEVTKSTAHMSNDRQGVYSEFVVRIDEFLKSESLAQSKTLKEVTGDRPGGYVRYPNGQKLIYLLDGADLPKVGGRYVMFLKREGRSPNYKILTLYELRNEGGVESLDPGDGRKKYRGSEKDEFLTTVRKAIQVASQ